MIVLGFLLSIVGAISTIYGIVMYNDASSEYYGLAKYFDSTDVNTARIVIIAGVIAFILGIVFLLIGYIVQSSHHSNQTKNNSNMNNLLDTRKCLQCGSVISRYSRFCPNCGKNLDN